MPPQLGDAVSTSRRAADKDAVSRLHITPAQRFAGDTTHK